MRFREILHFMFGVLYSKSFLFFSSLWDGDLKKIASGINLERSKRRSAL